MNIGFRALAPMQFVFLYWMFGFICEIVSHRGFEIKGKVNSGRAFKAAIYRFRIGDRGFSLENRPF